MSTEAKIPTKSRVGRGGPRNNGSSGKKDRRTPVKRRPDGENGSADTASGAQDHDEDDSCLICAEKIVVAAYSPCNHITCHKCTLRQRALYGKEACLVCRTENDSVIMADTIDKDYNWFPTLTIYDERTQIYFNNEHTRETVLSLLEIQCPAGSCGEKFDQFRGLQDHTRQAHNKFYCLICYNNKKAFISELPLFSYKALQNHQISGDQKGFAGHPECKHCKGRRFYSEDELNVHIRDSHERCHICDTDIPKQADYYRNYDAVFEHFRMAHFVCTVQSCLDKKFVVFREDLDLTAHMLKEHGGITGSNNRIVIGAGGRSFQGQLSTFEQPRNTARQQNRSKPDESADPKIKKMRLEERAKHYLEYNTTKLQDFIKLNNQFKSGEVTAQDLVNTYKTLFEKQTIAELAIILSELTELYPENSPKYKDLKAATTEYENNRINFPVLGGGNSGTSAVSLHGWGNSPGSSRNSSSDAFPVLSKPNKKATNVSANQPIRYTTVLKSHQNKKPVTINTFQGDASFQPSYLENRTRSNIGSPSSSANSSSSDLTKFPRLEKKTVKKQIPRVNPVNIPSPSTWGSSSQPQSPAPVEDFGIPVIDKRKKNKKKQILFSQ